MNNAQIEKLVNRPTTNNEVQVIDKNAVLSVNDISARGRKVIEKYGSLVRKGNKNVWDIATLVHNTVTCKTFKEDFGTMDIFGESLGLKKASISNMVKAVKTVASVPSIDMVSWTMGQIAEVMRLESEQIEQLVNNGTIDCTMTAREIRDAVKALKAPTDSKGKSDSDSDSKTDSDSDSDSKQDSKQDSKTDVIKVTLNDKGEVTEMEIDEATRDKILSILLNYGVAKRVNAK